MATTKNGHIELLPSGSYRARVYFGVDPVTGKERRVKRTVKTEARAAAELANLLRAAEAENAPDDAATLALALDRYLDVTTSASRPGPRTRPTSGGSCCPCSATSSSARSGPTASMLSTLT